MKKKLILLSLSCFFFANAWAQEIVPMHNDKGLFGYGIKGEKNFSIKPQWDEAKPFNSQGIAIVRKGEKFGLIDKSGKAVGPSMGYSLIAKYDGTDLWLVAQGGSRVDNVNKIKTRAGMIPYGFKGSLNYPIKGAKWGLVKSDGQYQIKPQYEELGNKMENGLIAITKGGLFGIIDMNGQVVYKPEYTSITPFNNQGIANFYSKKKKKWSLVTTNGKSIIESENKVAYLFNNDYWGSLNLLSADSLLHNKQYWGDKNRLMPISMLGSSWINSTHPYFALIGKVKKKKQMISELSVMDLQGNEIIPASEGLTQVFAPSEGIAVCYRGSQCGFYDIDAKTFLPVETRVYLPFKNGCSLSYSLTGSKDFYLVDKTGKQVSDRYDQVAVVNDRYVVKKGDKWGVIDYTGKVIISVECMGIGDASNGWFTVRNNVGAFGWMDKDGKTVIPFDYVEGSAFVNGYAIAGKAINDSTFTGKGCGIINQKNEVIVPLIYKKAVGGFDRNKNLHVWVLKNGVFNSYNINDASLTPTAYVDMDVASYGVITKNARGQYGLLLGSEEVIPCAVDNETTLKGIWEYMVARNLPVISATEARTISIRLMPGTNKFKLTDKISDSYWDF